MKKILTFALMAMSIAVMAQRVAPVNVRIVDLKLDSLREAYLSQPAMYQSSLKVLEQELNQNGADLKKARLELKAEQSHVKEMTATLKDAQKLVEGLKKTYEQEQKELKQMLKVVERQQQTLLKQKELNQETRASYTNLLETMQKELNYSVRDVADRQRAITDLEEELQRGRNSVNAYQQGTIQKEAEISALEAQYKQTVATLKQELKTAKSIQ